MNNDQSSQRISATTKSIIIIVAIVLLAVGAYLLAPKNSTSSATNESPAISSTSPSASPDTSSYKDGEYEANGSYSTPGGQENVEVQLTLKDGAITAIEATGSSRGGTSKEYQTEFLSNYKSSVVGKPISEVSLSRVAGSSLTSGGFNEALDEIKNDARS